MEYKKIILNEETTGPILGHLNKITKHIFTEQYGACSENVDPTENSASSINWTIVKSRTHTPRKASLDNRCDSWGIFIPLYYKEENNIILEKNSIIYLAEGHVIVRPAEPFRGGELDGIFIYLKIFIEKDYPENKVEETFKMMMSLGKVYVNTDHDSGDVFQ